MEIKAAPNAPPICRRLRRARGAGIAEGDAAFSAASPVRNCSIKVVAPRLDLLRQVVRDATPLEAIMGLFKSVFDPLDLEIIDRVYEVAWAHAQAREPSRNTASDGTRQKALRRKIFGIARIEGPGHIDYDTLAEVVLASISEQPERAKSA